MTRVDAATRMAYVDGELDEIARRRVERAIADDPALAEAVARDRALREALRARFDPYANAPVPECFHALIETNVTPLAPPRRRRTAMSNARHWAQAAALAATLVLGVGIGHRLGTSGPVASRNGALVAHGPLARALDAQLASTQPSDAPIRIGLTFRDHEGAICRTFTGAALQGIACRDDGRWSLARTATGERTGTYRQAASGALIDAAKNMMAGSAFSAAEETAAKSRNWN